jgi:hypothetical protein
MRRNKTVNTSNLTRIVILSLINLLLFVLPYKELHNLGQPGSAFVAVISYPFLIVVALIDLKFSRDYINNTHIHGKAKMLSRAVYIASAILLLAMIVPLLYGIIISALGNFRV